MGGKKMPTVASFFSGCGGLDLGFKSAGFDVVYANDNSKTVWETYERNFGHAIDRRSIAEVPASEIPDADGFIGGPPCQSWSIAGSNRGSSDPRGRLFYVYADLIGKKRPKFFVAENVGNIAGSLHLEEFNRIKAVLSGCGYNVSAHKVDCAWYGVPQRRVRVFTVGVRDDVASEYQFPTYAVFPKPPIKTVRDAISDVPPPAAVVRGGAVYSSTPLQNNEYLEDGFSPMFLSRNRQCSWGKPSYTILASARHIPIHPDSPKMVRVGPDEWGFRGEGVVRRLSVRECARIQTFPDDFVFYYKNISDGYRMVGNAVPVLMARRVAENFLKSFFSEE